ncbi:MAG: hypothetical protein J6Q55_00305 [Clostridia bacterium]|nr:hypothetical protein [Clostridia bacterium]
MNSTIENTLIDMLNATCDYSTLSQVNCQVTKATSLPRVAQAFDFSVALQGFSKYLNDQLDKDYFDLWGKTYALLLQKTTQIASRTDLYYVLMATILANCAENSFFKMGNLVLITKLINNQDYPLFAMANSTLFACKTDNVTYQIVQVDDKNRVYTLHKDVQLKHGHLHYDVFQTDAQFIIFEKSVFDAVLAGLSAQSFRQID